MNEDPVLIEKIAIRLATIDGNWYWKHNFPEESREYVKKRYESEAQRHLEVLKVIDDYRMSLLLPK